MQVPDPDALLLQVFREVFGHALGEGSDEHALALRSRLVYLSDQIVDLTLRWPDFDLRIEQSGRPDELLCGDAARSIELVFRRCCRDIHSLPCQLGELFKPQRPVVEGRRQSESVFDQRLLACAVAVVHRAELRQHRVRFVYYRKEIAVREVVEQRVRPLARLQEVYMPRVVLNALAGADFHHHFNIVIGALLKPLGLEQFAVGAEPVQPLTQLFPDRRHGQKHVFPAGYVVARREYGDM